MNKRLELKKERDKLIKELGSQSEYDSSLLIGKTIEEIDKEIRRIRQKGELLEGKNNDGL